MKDIYINIIIPDDQIINGVYRNSAFDIFEVQNISLSNEAVEALKNSSVVIVK